MFKKCKGCHIAFEATTKNRKFCTVICSSKYYKKTHPIYSLRSERKKRGTYEKWAGFLRDGGYLVIGKDELVKIQKTGKSVWYI